MPVFAVIIPFFQREGGVLARALASIAGQDFSGEICVYLVDDGSPVRPEAEIKKVAWPCNISVKILTKKNGGPGSARNLGLNSLGSEPYVGFLDSDDVWRSHHLSSARFAFENGFDYYTSETLDVNGRGLHAQFYPGGLPLRPMEDRPWAHELMAPLINYTIWSPISGSSAMVATRTLIGETRFNEALRSAGEDGLFATTLAAKRPRVMIASRPDVQRGRGVNIFTEGDWGSRQAWMRSRDFLVSRLLMKPLVLGFAAAETTLVERIGKARQYFWSATLAAARRRNLPMREFAQAMLRYPCQLTGFR